MHRSLKHMVRLLAAAVVLLTATTAHAAAITWGPDVYDPDPDIYMSDGFTVIYSHDLTAYGFVPGALSNDQVTGGTLEIVVYDDAEDPGGQAEKMKINLENLGFGGAETATTTFTFNNLSVQVLASLQEDGILNVVVAHQAGDFYFDESIFTAEGTRTDGQGGEEGREDGQGEPGAAVPEPLSLTLFGTGLVGLALKTRRRNPRLG